VHIGAQTDTTATEEVAQRKGKTN